MNEQERKLLLTMQQIAGIFIKNGENCTVTIDGETAVFGVSNHDVSYKESLVEAGATYDITRSSWVYWYEE